MEPLVSVIVPVYNVEKYLPRCIDSILAQTYSNLEIILIDDGSRDSGGAICDSYASQDSRIRVRHQANAGIGTTRNTGLSLCTGEYITFVDSDDFLYPDSVQKLCDRIRTDGSDLVIGNCVRVYEDGTHSDAYFSFEDHVYSRDEILSRMAVFGAIPTAPWGKLYSRKALEGISYPAVRTGEDTLAFPHILDRCSRISLENEPVYHYFYRNGSLMRDMSEQTKKDNLHAGLYVARYLWDNGHPEGAANWYSVSAKNALAIRGSRHRLSEFHGYFDRRTRRALLRYMDRRGKLAWYGIHIPPICYAIRRRSSNRKKGRSHRQP